MVSTSPNICITCRGVNKHNVSSCPGEFVRMSYRWRAPKKSNNKAWNMVANGDVWWDKRHITRKAIKKARRFTNRIAGQRKRNTKMNENLTKAHLLAGKEYGQESTCGAKVDYKTERTATEVAAKLSLKFNKKMEAYPCYWCQGWHIGRKMEEKELKNFLDKLESTC